jgi:hypothetical protein
MTTEHTGGSFRQIKKKAIQFKCGRLLANYRDRCLQLPPRAARSRPIFGSKLAHTKDVRLCASQIRADQTWKT